MQTTPFYAESTAHQRRIMRGFIAAAGALIALCSLDLALTFPVARPGLIAVALGVLGGYFVADVISGVVHWAMDTWFQVAEVGRLVAIAREHHTHPQNILGYSFLEYGVLGAAPALPAVGLVALPLAMAPPSPVTWAAMAGCWTVGICLLFGTSFHNLGHAWARWLPLRLAQRAGLVMSPAHHRRHHVGDRTVGYCVVNGWANPLFDRLRLWRALEWIIARLTGACPRVDDQAFVDGWKKTGTLPAIRL